MQTANERQVGGNHYQKNAIACPHCGKELQHWDIYKFFPYLVGTIAKYLWRWRDKNGVEDLDKARHYLDKLVEVETRKADGFTPIHVTEELPKCPQCETNVQVVKNSCSYYCKSCAFNFDA